MSIVRARREHQKAISLADKTKEQKRRCDVSALDIVLNQATTFISVLVLVRKASDPPPQSGEWYATGCAVAMAGAYHERYRTEKRRRAHAQMIPNPRARRVNEVLRNQRYLVQRLARSGPVATTQGRGVGASAVPGVATPGSVRPLSVAGTASMGVMLPA